GLHRYVRPGIERDGNLGMARFKRLLQAAATMLVSGVLFLGLAELVLRFLPVATWLHPLSVTAENPVLHFTPNRDFVYSKRWDMIMANRGHVNNAGFVNDRDYRLEDAKPLLAVVGDSFIEATMVPFPETMHGRLAEALDRQLRVYSFAASGAPLSQ